MTDSPSVMTMAMFCAYGLSPCCCVNCTVRISRIPPAVYVLWRSYEILEMAFIRIDLLLYWFRYIEFSTRVENRTTPICVKREPMMYFETSSFVKASTRFQLPLSAKFMLPELSMTKTMSRGTAQGPGGSAIRGNLKECTRQIRDR